MRTALVGLIVLATIGFVIGTSIERHNSHNESAAQLKAERAAAETGSEPSPTTSSESGESPAEHTAESGGEGPAGLADEGGTPTTEQHKELRPLGIDIEAVPFVILAALASLALAALGWARPRWLPGLVAIGLAMLVFGVLDVREAFHQSDENQTGLVILAAAIAVLHFGAAGCAALMAVRRDGEGAMPVPATAH